MSYDYWLEYLNNIKYQWWDIDKYILLFFLTYGKYKCKKFPDVRFWSQTFLFITMATDIKILFRDDTILTPQIAFTEMEDCYWDELPIVKRMMLKIKSWWKK